MYRCIRRSTPHSNYILAWGCYILIHFREVFGDTQLKMSKDKSLRFSCAYSQKRISPKAGGLQGIH